MLQQVPPADEREHSSNKENMRGSSVSLAGGGEWDEVVEGDGDEDVEIVGATSGRPCARLPKQPPRLHFDRLSSISNSKLSVSALGTSMVDLTLDEDEAEPKFKNNAVPL